MGERKGHVYTGTVCPAIQIHKRLDTYDVHKQVGQTVLEAGFEIKKKKLSLSLSDVLKIALIQFI
jgi:hypothetical protein